MLHRLLLFAHVLFAFLYFLAHGASVAVAYRVRRETNAERVRALLDLSWSTIVASYQLLLGTIVCGVVLGFLGHWWSARWIWTSIIILLLIVVVMARAAAPRYRGLRKAVGLEFVDGKWEHRGPELSPDELARVLAALNPAAITAAGVGGWAVILWLMLFKPF
jgi:hypothetical protein